MCTYRAESTSDSYNIAASCFFFFFFFYYSCYRLSRSFATEPNMKAGTGHSKTHLLSFYLIVYTSTETLYLDQLRVNTRTN